MFTFWNTVYPLTLFLTFIYILKALIQNWTQQIYYRHWHCYNIYYHIQNNYHLCIRLHVLGYTLVYSVLQLFKGFCLHSTTFSVLLWHGCIHVSVVLCFSVFIYISPINYVLSMGIQSFIPSIMLTNNFNATLCSDILY